MVAFRGGMDFHPGRPVRVGPPPETLPARRLRLRCAERPEVQTGQAVRQGQVLLQPSRQGGGAQISPISGSVQRVAPLIASIGDVTGAPPGYEVVLEPAGERVEPSIPLDPPRGRNFDVWLSAMHRVGPWGELDGGVGILPQLEAARQRPADTVICVGVDAFPPYPDRSSLLASFPDDAVLGTLLIADLVGAKNVVMLIARQRRVHARLRPACRNYNVRLQRASRFYPAADPTLVAWGAAPPSGRGLRRRRRRLPHRANPVEAGLVIVDPWTAIRLGRWFTLHRLDVARPMLIAWPEPGAPLTVAYGLPGAPLASLDERLAQDLAKHAHRVVIGNPMTGRAIDAAARAVALDLESATLREEEAEPLVPADELLVSVLPEMTRGRPQPCISCGWCAEVCPTRLRPIDLMRLAQGRRDEGHLADQLAWCIDCGLCSHVCPVALPLTETLREASLRLRVPAPARPKPVAHEPSAEAAAAARPASPS